MYKKIRDAFDSIDIRMLRSKIVVYTAIFGDYDDLKEPVNVKGCDFVCFTDNTKLVSDKFEIRLCAQSKDSIRESKKYKILPHKYLPEYKYSIWIDGSIRLKEINFKNIIKYYLNKQDLAIFSHPERDCVYEELAICRDLKKDDCDVMERQVRRYEVEGYPMHNGLVAGGFIARRTLSPEVIRFSEDWWHEIQNNSRRDQLSFNYIAWRNGFEYNIINKYLWDNEYFTVCPHNNR